MPLSPGTRLGSYEIIAGLGSGGMGEVYRARDRRLNRDVAIKVLPSLVASDADRLARFEREAQAVAALSHPDILAIHEFGSDGRTAFAVMELPEGETLRQCLADGPLGVRKALEYMSPTTTPRPLWYWCVLGAVAMSLGWGLRGSIGGGSLGAMIPGAMIGLVLCLMLDRHSDAGLIAAFAAIGVGFGGQETYGQTVGLSLQPETFWWAILGFAIKGAAWGLLGGAFIGIALERQRYSTAQLLAGFAIIVFGTWLGWQFLNNPKLVYFSNRLDRPREELWAGLWLGGLLLLAWLHSRVPSLFALYGAIGGGIGFGAGASLQPIGRVIWAGMPLGWWKAMELTFGALLGLAFVLCAWRLRHQLAGAPSTPTAAFPLPRAFLAAIVAIGLAVVSTQYVPARFEYTIAGAVLASLVLFSESLAWQTAITATSAAFWWDFLDYQTFAPRPLVWAFLVVVTAVVTVIVARHPRTRPMLLLLTWLAVDSAFRYLLPPSAVGREVVTMLTVFVLMALGMTFMLVSWGRGVEVRRDLTVVSPP